MCGQPKEPSLTSDAKPRPVDKPMTTNDNAADAQSPREFVRAREYTFDQLADVYNQARVDYIVPMPMNGKRMQEYVEFYDVDLSASFVSLNDEGLESGVGMLGIRNDRSWITRLGVVPHRRKRHVGQRMMQAMLDESIRRKMRLCQLEVIAGNEPAHRLFVKLGFEETRELLIIRRPPGMPDPNPIYDAAEVREIDAAEIPEILATRPAGANWLNETPSLLNAGNLRGVMVTMPDGDSGWIVFRRTAFQLTHFAISRYADDPTMCAVIYHMHRLFPMQDTKFENLAVNSPLWPAFQAAGYFEVFRRIEMFLYF